MSTEEQNPQNKQPATSASNQMIEQINIALEQKGSGNFSAWVIEACRRRLTSEKRVYTSPQKWWRMNIPRSSSEQDDNKIHLITRALQ